ncbi:hypothetical protein ANRL1_00337 [Anaerolineae bacterium]|nr:hypothetical protein ANRL1_00337 [Anaerolineae bacterium]
MVNAAGEQDKPETIGSSEARFFNLTVNAKRDQLLAEESILGDELRLRGRFATIESAIEQWAG